MAMARSTRSAPPPYALITFVFLWFLATAGSAILYVQLGKAQKKLSTAGSRLAQFASDRDMAQQNVRNMLARASLQNTVLDQMTHEIHELEFQIFGAHPAATVKALTGPVGPIARTLSSVGMPNQSLLGAVEKLRNQLAIATRKSRRYQASLALYQRRFQSANGSFVNDQHALHTELHAARRRIDELTADLTRVRNELAGQATRLQKKLSHRQRRFIGELRTQVVLKNQYRQELAIRERLVRQLRRDIAGARPPAQGAAAILAQADGKVSRVSTANNNVYINIGTREHVAPGLTFAVYSPALGVGSGPHGGGKASITVTRAGPYAAVARITHVRDNQAIYPGDLIANPVFRRAMTHRYHFFVTGDFDVNGNGVPTAQGRRQIVNLIRQWGGVVDKKLTSQTDFLVLGARPAPAALNFGPARTPQSASIAAMRRTAQMQYSALETKAQSLSIPILDANRFLAMIGYYAHPLVRR